MTRGRGTQALRQLELLRLLVRHGAVDLPGAMSGAELLGAGWRTLRRDVQQLAELGAPVAIEEGSLLAGPSRAVALGRPELARWMVGPAALRQLRA